MAHAIKKADPVFCEVHHIPKNAERVCIPYPHGGHIVAHFLKHDGGTLIYLGDDSPKSEEPIFLVNNLTYHTRKQAEKLAIELFNLMNDGE